MTWPGVGPFAYSLDVALMGLRCLGVPYHRDAERDDRWWSACPSCDSGVLRITELQYDHIEAYCDRRCRETDIIVALGAQVRQFLLELKGDRRAA